MLLIPQLVPDKVDYQTYRANVGANHVVIDNDTDNNPDLFLGLLVDTDIDGQPTTMADGDNLINLADEDGVTTNGTYVLNRPRDIDITIGKDPDFATSSFHLYGWIDWNQDGDFDDANELVVSETSVAISTNTYTITPPSDAILGTTFARFRLCSTGDCNTPNGASIDGEVEDYG